MTILFLSDSHPCNEVVSGGLWLHPWVNVFDIAHRHLLGGVEVTFGGYDLLPTILSFYIALFRLFVIIITSNLIYSLY